jgi:hypothetical protein
MQSRPWHVIGLSAIALLALWLLLAGPKRLLGLDAGHVGMVLLVTAAWSSLLALARLPRGEAETAIAPGEWTAWIGTGFMLAAVVYLLAKADVFAAASFDDPGARAIARNLVLLLIAWAVVSRIFAARWKGTVQEDERDREIAVRAAAWGRGALIVAMIMIAVTPAFSPDARLTWASHFAIANMLVFALMCGWLFECAAAAAIYLRDRRASAR